MAAAGALVEFSASGLPKPPLPTARPTSSCVPSGVRRTSNRGGGRHVRDDRRFHGTDRGRSDDAGLPGGGDAGRALAGTHPDRVRAAVATPDRIPGDTALRHAAACNRPRPTARRCDGRWRATTNRLPSLAHARSTGWRWPLPWRRLHCSSAAGGRARACGRATRPARRPSPPADPSATAARRRTRSTCPGSATSARRR